MLWFITGVDWKPKLHTDAIVIDGARIAWVRHIHNEVLLVWNLEVVAKASAPIKLPSCW